MNNSLDILKQPSMIVRYMRDVENKFNSEIISD